MPEAFNIIGNVELNTAPAERQLGNFLGKKRTLYLDDKISTQLQAITKSTNEFDLSLSRATNRVFAFAVARSVLSNIEKGFSSFIKATIDVENQLAKIQVNLNETTTGLEKFSSSLFNVARETGTSFEETAKAAAEFARQGLGAEETLKRTRDALILSRISAISTTEAVNDLTGAINSFSKEALTSSDIINKFVAIDTRFAVNAKDLADGLQRAGAVAADTGVSMDKLLGIITAVKQTTGRDGAIIGNALKTIFERAYQPATLKQFGELGIATKDLKGNLLPVDVILKNLAKTYDKLSQSQQQQVSRSVANIQQINVFKALLNDLTKTYSISENAAKAAANATDEAFQKNITLNKTLKTAIDNTETSLTQLFANIGKQDISPFLKTILGAFEKARSFLSGDAGDKLGEILGNGLLRGLSNVFTGPVLAGAFYAIGRAFSKVIEIGRKDIQGLIGINSVASQRIEIQTTINKLIEGATIAQKQEIAAATTLVELNEILLRLAKERAALGVGNPMLVDSFIQQEGFLGKSVVNKGLKGVIPSAADPVASAIEREMAMGIPRDQIYIDRDQRLVSSENPQGIMVANRRDEPVGGFQGVNRILSQGGDPRKAGLGKIPSFADPLLTQAEIIARRFGINDPRYDEGMKNSKVPDSFAAALARSEAEVERLAAQTKKVQVALDLFDKGLVQSSRSLSVQQKIQKEVTAAVARQSFSDVEEMRRPVDRSGGPYQIPPGILTAQDIPDDLLPENSPVVRKRRLAAAQARAEQKKTLARRERLNKISFAAIFAAPLAAGFIDPVARELGIDTRSGRGILSGGTATGALSGALNFGGIGAVLGPEGALAGAAIGALVGGFNKLSKSTEEVNSEFEDSKNTILKEREAINQVINLTSQLQDAQKGGANQSVINKILNSISEAKGQVTTSRGREILGIGDSTKQREAVENFNLSSAQEILLNNAVRLINSNELGGKGGNEALNSLKNGITGNLSKEDLGFVGAIARQDFSSDKVNYSNTQGTAFELLKKSAGEEAARKLQPIAEKLGIKGTDLDQNNVSKTAELVLKALLLKAKESKEALVSPENAFAFKNSAAFQNINFQGEESLRAFGQVRRPGTINNRGNALLRDQTFIGAISKLEELGAYGQNGLLAQEGAGGEGVILSNKARARVGLQGGLSAAADVITGIPRFRGIPLRNPTTGQFNIAPIVAILTTMSKSIDKEESYLGKVFQKFIETAQGNVTGLEAKRYTPYIKGGLVEGIKYETYAGQKPAYDPDYTKSSIKFGSDSQGATVDKILARQYFKSHAIKSDSSDIDLDRAKSDMSASLESINTAAKVIAGAKLNVDGTIHIISDSLSSSKLEELANELTELIGKRFIAEQNNTNRRISELERLAGRPNPPVIPAPMASFPLSSDTSNLITNNPFTPN